MDICKIVRYTIDESGRVFQPDEVSDICKNVEILVRADYDDAQIRILQSMAFFGIIIGLICVSNYIIRKILR